MLRRRYIVAVSLLLLCAAFPGWVAADPIVITSGHRVADGDEPAFGTHFRGRDLKFDARDFAGSDLPCVGGPCFPGERVDFSTQGTVRSYEPAFVDGVSVPIADASLVFSVASAQLPRELGALYSTV